MNPTKSLTLAAAALVVFGTACNRTPGVAPGAPPAPAAPAAPAPAAPGAPAAGAPATPAAPAAPGAPTTSIAGEPIPDLPDYPNAVRVKYANGGPKGLFARSVETELYTTDTVDAVKAYYKDAISKGGWNVVKASEKIDEADWDLSKNAGAAQADLEIDAKKTGGVTIKIERKDR